MNFGRTENFLTGYTQEYFKKKKKKVVLSVITIYFILL